MERRIIRAHKRHFSDIGWLKTYWLFSFSQYYDPDNVNHGALRVFNDDTVSPGGGFPMHQHRDMEIVTVVLEGEITHEDSMGNKETISAGEVQAMTAGSGIFHSEFNHSDNILVLYQIWIFPEKKSLTPGYEVKKYDPSKWHNKLYPLASGRGFSEDVLKINVDAAIYRCDLDTGKSIAVESNPRRKIFVYVTSGVLSFENEVLQARDQARITAEKNFTIAAKERADFILIDVPE